MDLKFLVKGIKILTYYQVLKFSNSTKQLINMLYCS